MAFSVRTCYTAYTEALRVLAGCRTASTLPVSPRVPPREGCFKIVAYKEPTDRTGRPRVHRVAIMVQGQDSEEDGG